MLACEKGSLSIAALLVKDGANIDLQNSVCILGINFSV